MSDAKSAREARRIVAEKFRAFIAAILAQFPKKPEQLVEEVEAKANRLTEENMR